MIGKAAIGLLLVATMGASLGATLGSAPACAAESAAVSSKRAVVTLISDADTVRPGVPLHLALRLRLAPGWHTYWRNPGDAGVEPDLALTLPAGAAAGPIAWPAPQRLPEGPVMSYGYTGQVVLPLTLTPGPGVMDVTATATWLVCEKVCVPEEGTFQLTLPPGNGAASREAPLVIAALARVPRPSPFQARVAPDGTLELSGTGLSSETVRDAWFFPGAPGLIDQAAPQRVSVAPGRVSLSLAKAAGFQPDVPLRGVVVLRDPGGEESALEVGAAPGPAAAATADPVWQTLLLAALGGLILNLMPCVFPILAMKAVALSRASGQARREVRAQAASYTAGILLAFAALGAVMLSLRSAGSAVGWGFQFQSPVFVVAMAWVLFAVGLSLSGVFEVGGRLAGAGQQLAGRRGHVGSFFTGLLAVVVATPCTAPFMGAAIATALAAPPALTLATFLAMGLGLAAPYALLGLWPGLAARLPRPGAWTDILKRVLAFPMYAAAAWLVWVTSLEAGPDGVLLAGTGLVLIGFAAWVYGAGQASGRQTSGRRIGAMLALVSLFAAGALLPRLTLAAPLALAEDTEAFTPARLAGLRAAGRPVFVNMTAAWCVTCLVNERLALSPAAVQRAFADHHVAYLKGDWTRGDPAITAFLREHARDGVPLYVLFIPGDPVPTVLPQILTEPEMLAQLSRIRT